MANFIENFRTTQPAWQKAAPLGVISNKIIPKNTAVPSQEALGQWNNWRREQAEQQKMVSRDKGVAATRGTLFTPESPKTGRVSTDLPVDITFYENQSVLEDLADEYEKANDHDIGGQLIKKYYDKLKNGSELLKEALASVAYQNDLVKDISDRGGEKFNAKGVADYIRLMASAAKTKYGPKKV